VKHTVTLIPGDGTGPEIVAVARDVWQALPVELEFEVVEAGAGVVPKYGTPLPDFVLDSIKKNKVAIKGPIITPVGKGFRSVNVAIRKALDLYVCLRPCKWYPGVRSPYKDIDIVIVRENTEDLYAGVEFEQGTDEAKELIAFLKSKGKVIREDSGISIKPISIFGTRRVVKFAFEYAKKYGRKLVTAVHKANIMKFSDGLFLEVARQVAEEYGVKVNRTETGIVTYEGGEIAFDDRIVDNMAMQLVQTPERYDVLVLPNLYGDIISDLCAGLVGGLGVAPGGNIGDEYAVFEATHGAAPKYVGMDKVNPSAVILSGMMMLRHLGETKSADILERAFANVVAEGKKTTYDMRADKNDPTAAKMSEFGKAIIEEIERIRKEEGV